MYLYLHPCLYLTAHKLQPLLALPGPWMPSYQVLVFCPYRALSRPTPSTPPIVTGGGMPPEMGLTVWLPTVLSQLAVVFYWRGTWVLADVAGLGC